jgi:hypothetical protein
MWCGRAEEGGVGVDQPLPEVAAPFIPAAGGTRCAEERRQLRVQVGGDGCGGGDDDGGHTFFIGKSTFYQVCLLGVNGGPPPGTSVR